MKTDRFFDDKEFENEVKLTQKEAELLSNFESEEVYCSGLGNISGGFAQITLEELDEEDDDIILGNIKSGEQNDCVNNVSTDRIIFNRKDSTIKFD